MDLRTYQAALNALDSLPHNAAAMAVTKELSPMGEALQFLRRMGYRPEDLNKLNVIHVAGTKGKGSTCAYCYSLLREAAPQLKIGLFISPHLVSVRERIQIDGKLISFGDFARFFFEVWDKLEATKDQGHPDAPMPSPLRMLTLVAYHAFLCLNVDATILEALVGGRVDGTNVVPEPIVTGITSLGIDHTSLLGNTLSEIAWHKAGIYKAGVPAYTVNQPPEALEVVKQEAEKAQASEFHIVDALSELSEIKLGIPGAHQRQNASLAIHLVHRFLQLRNPAVKHPYLSPISEVYAIGLNKARLAGRCQQVADPSSQSLQWFIDGAHTIESLAFCAEWYFTPELAFRLPEPKRTLIFNCADHRPGKLLLDTLLQKAARRMLLANVKNPCSGFLFSQVIFFTKAINSAGFDKQANRNKPLTPTPEWDFASTWADLVPGYPEENVHVVTTIQESVDLVHRLHPVGETADVLVCGSMHLVGGLISAAKIEDRV